MRGHDSRFGTVYVVLMVLFVFHGVALVFHGASLVFHDVSLVFLIDCLCFTMFLLVFHAVFSCFFDRLLVITGPIGGQKHGVRAIPFSPVNHFPVSLSFFPAAGYRGGSG